VRSTLPAGVSITQARLAKARAKRQQADHDKHLAPAQRPGSPRPSGAPARIDPRLPISMHSPVIVAKRRSSKPSASSLSMAMKVDRNAEADQGAPDEGQFEARRKAEQDGPDTRHQPAPEQDAARSQGVRQHPGGDLHQRIDVEVGRRQGAELGAADGEGACRSPEIAAGATRWKKDSR
jgi:hypothetical protein